eukprot:g6535.t1
MASFSSAAEVQSVAEALTGLMLEDPSEQKRSSAFKILSKVLGNIAASPSEAKYRTLKVDNKTVAKLLTVEGTRELLVAAGFVDSGATLSLPESAELEPLHAALAVVLERSPAPAAAEAEQKEAAPGGTASSTASSTASPAKQLSPEVIKCQQAAAVARAKKKAEREAIKRQMELDKKERKERGPAKASKAVKKAFGAASKTFEDIGVNLNAGGG